MNVYHVITITGFQFRVESHMTYNEVVASLLTSRDAANVLVGRPIGVKGAPETSIMPWNVGLIRPWRPDDVR